MRKVVTIPKIRKATKSKVAVKPQYKPLRIDGWTFVGRYLDHDLYAQSNPPATRRVCGNGDWTVYEPVSATHSINRKHEGDSYYFAHTTARRLAKKMGIKGF